MILLCSFKQGNVEVEGPTTFTHRLCIDFLTRIGIDGATPHVGENGNWWVREEDTGVPAGVVCRFSTYLEFPTVGRDAVLYLDEAANKLYKWNQTDLHYYVVGSDYNQIQIIDGGNA